MASGRGGQEALVVHRMSPKNLAPIQLITLTLLLPPHNPEHSHFLFSRAPLPPLSVATVLRVCACVRACKIEHVHLTLTSVLVHST